MPIPRPRRKDHRLDYVIVQRTGLDGKEVVGPVETTVQLAAPVDLIVGHPNTRRQYDDPKLELNDGYDSGDEDDDGRGPPKVRRVEMCTLENLFTRPGYCYDDYDDAFSTTNR